MYIAIQLHLGLLVKEDTDKIQQDIFLIAGGQCFDHGGFGVFG